jgi:hypothetical protein
MKRIFTILLIVIVTMSVFTLTAFADEPTEAVTEAMTEAPTEALTEASTEATTTAPTEAPTAKPTDAPTESPTEEQGTPITFGMVKDIANTTISFINRHKETILSGASAFASLVLSFIVGKIFKPRLKAITKKTEEAFEAISSKFKEAEDANKAEIAELRKLVEEHAEATKKMIESYEKERADLHAADATAEIDHEFATMMYHLIMNSNVGMGIKDEVEQLYKDSEEKIKHMIEDAKDERGKEHGTGEEQSTEV